MEEVEEANKTAVGSCHRVLSLLSQPKDQVQSRNLAVETVDAVSKFKRVVSLLSNGVGHARVRKSKKPQFPFPQNILLDTPNPRTEQPSRTLQFLQPNFNENPFQDPGSNSKNSLSLGNTSLELSSNGKNPLHLSQQTPAPPHYQFLQQQQQQQQQKLQLQQQQMKQQAQMMYRRSNSGISLNFDNSSCTPTMSSTRSFISSLSMDGSVANLDGTAFHLIGAPRSSDQSSLQQKRKCSAKEDGSVKCGSSGRCHCSKKRLVFPEMLHSIVNLGPFGIFWLIDWFFALNLVCFTLHRKHRVKRQIKVPAISNKLADIPPDDYSWRKYGQKPIKGSPHPRYA